MEHERVLGARRLACETGARTIWVGRSGSETRSETREPRTRAPCARHAQCVARHDTRHVVEHAKAQGPPGRTVDLLDAPHEAEPCIRRGGSDRSGNRRHDAWERLAGYVHALGLQGGGECRGAEARRFTQALEEERRDGAARVRGQRRVECGAMKRRVWIEGLDMDPRIFRRAAHDVLLFRRAQAIDERRLEEGRAACMPQEPDAPCAPRTHHGHVTQLHVWCESQALTRPGPYQAHIAHAA